MQISQRSLHPGASLLIRETMAPVDTGFSVISHQSSVSFFFASARARSRLFKQPNMVTVFQPRLQPLWMPATRAATLEKGECKLHACSHVL